MDDMVFATLLEYLSDAWDEKISKPDLIQILYDGVADPVNVLNENNEPIYVPKGTASKIFNRKLNAHQKIRDAVDDDRVKQSIEEYFKARIVPHISSFRRIDLIDGLTEVIENDTQVKDKGRYISLANEDHIALFLSEVYLYSLTRNNIIKEGHRKLSQGAADNLKKHGLHAIPVPTRIGSDERKYTDALFEVYAQATGRKTFRKKDLEASENSDYADHFAEQRKYFFAAEAVRRGTRDIYGEEEEDQFNVLETETYDGIIDIWRDPRIRSGFDRLSTIFKNISQVDLSKCWLKSDTRWIGIAERKGVCHFLIKDGRLKGWVRGIDDEDI